MLRRAARQCRVSARKKLEMAEIGAIEAQCRFAVLDVKEAAAGQLDAALGALGVVRDDEHDDVGGFDGLLELAGVHGGASPVIRRKPSLPGPSLPSDPASG